MGFLIFGALAALILFWAVGAHNRLVRLRSEVIRQWSSVDAVWLRLLVRLQGGITARQTLADATGAQDLQALQTACDDMLEALTLVRLQPLDDVNQKVLIAQHLNLVSEIRSLQQTANQAIQPDLEIALNRMRQTLPAAMIPYNVAVSAYNDALRMRPASWLARRLKYKTVLRMDLTASTH